MLNNIIYYPIFGKPLIMYGGLFTLLCFLITVALAYLNQKKPRQYPLKWHKGMAFLTLILVIIHGILGVLAFF